MLNSHSLKKSSAENYIVLVECYVHPPVFLVNSAQISLIEEVDVFFRAPASFIDLEFFAGLEYKFLFILGQLLWKNNFLDFIAIVLFLEPYPPLNVGADVTSKDITVRWNYNIENNKKFPIIDYGLWYQESGGTEAVAKMTWSNIVNDTGPPVVLSYTFQDILKPYTNYSIRVRGYNQYDSKSSSKVSIETESTGIKYLLCFCVEESFRKQLFKELIERNYIASENRWSSPFLLTLNRFPLHWDQHYLHNSEAAAANVL